MPREIKFRAWHEGQKRMIYGPRSNEVSPSWVLTMCEANNIEPMQYTGLKDKNGTEIYEGDIISGGYVIESEMVWNCGCCDFIYGWNIPFINDCEKEVIGNIYETPELIK